MHCSFWTNFDFWAERKRSWAKPSQAENPPSSIFGSSQLTLDSSLVFEPLLSNVCPLNNVFAIMMLAPHHYCLLISAFFSLVFFRFFFVFSLLESYRFFYIPSSEHIFSPKDNKIRYTILHCFCYFYLFIYAYPTFDNIIITITGIISLYLPGSIIEV